jgi:hypothetical protein
MSSQGMGGAAIVGVLVIAMFLLGDRNVKVGMILAIIIGLIVAFTPAPAVG